MILDVNGELIIFHRMNKDMICCVNLLLFWRGNFWPSLDLDFSPRNLDSTD